MCIYIYIYIDTQMYPSLPASISVSFSPSLSPSLSRSSYALMFFLSSSPSLPLTPSPSLSLHFSPSFSLSCFRPTSFRPLPLPLTLGAYPQQFQKKNNLRTTRKEEQTQERSIPADCLYVPLVFYFSDEHPASLHVHTNRKVYTYICTYIYVYIYIYIYVYFP